MTTANSELKQPAANRSAWLEFLGSMNLAITLLVAVAIASIVGTVLQQNQPYQDYIIKFGQFWFEVFNALGLFDVYSSGWFLVILTFLVISTSVCVIRNAPVMIRDMRSFRSNVQRKSLSLFKHNKVWLLDRPSDEFNEVLPALLKSNGYRYKIRTDDDSQLFASVKGAFNRFGYIFTHLAIIVICLGALFDGNIPLKLREMRGLLEIETRDITASEVPAISRLPVENPSFRGNVRIPENTSANIVFLQMRDGFLVQPLPFSIEVKDFRIEHYSSGQPKAFESDLVITDPEAEGPVETTISVNHPMTYKGYAIYQASFSDGGTGLELAAWPLSSSTREPVPVNGRIFDDESIETPNGKMTIEFTDFRLFNINPVTNDDGSVDQTNFGPMFTWKLRDVSGNALEYETYMSPVPFNDRLYFLSGVRDSAAEPFRYLHIPADPKGTMNRFLHFNALLNNSEAVMEVAREATSDTLALSSKGIPEVTDEVVQSMASLIGHFAQGGFEAVVKQVEDNVPEEKREDVVTAYMKVLQTLLGGLYIETLEAEGVDLAQGISPVDEQFFDDVVNTVSALGMYGSPFFLELKNFDFVQASGLQIARAPGKNVVYLGFAMLTLGVFLMFYLPHRRLWFWVDKHEGKTRLLMAGTGHRHERDFVKEFEQLGGKLDEYFNQTNQSRG